MLNLWKTAAAAASFGVMATAATAEPIKIAINEWTGQHLSANIAGSVLKEMGFEVEYVTASSR